MTQQRVAIVTGASSGIGAETARAFAKRGWAVVLAARRAERLEQVAADCRASGAEPLVRPTDVSVEKDVFGLVADARNAFGRVDAMVNNAGYGLQALAHETTTEDMRAIFETNYFGAFFGCRAAAPVMIAQGSGHIFNVSSVIGRRGTPFHGAYCATKFALIGLTESMRVELAPRGVHVTAVLPGLTATEFFDDSPEAEKARSSFTQFRGMMPPRVVGQSIAAHAGRRCPELVFSTGGKLLTLLGPLAPGLTDRIMKVYYDDLARRLDGGDGGADDALPAQ